MRTLAKPGAAKFLDYSVGSSFGLKYSENLVDWVRSRNSFAEKRSSFRHNKGHYTSGFQAEFVADLHRYSDLPFGGNYTFHR